MVRIVQSAHSETHGRSRERPALKHHPFPEEVEKMYLLWVIAVVFFVLWLLGFAAFHVTTGFIHLLLVLAVVAVVFQLISGRRTA
jgi:hypothetical protein